ncbi:hypothetical protein [Paractinoplanes maris]|uniref:hypothetical protein n=1 Tax=Paractinoplanes maris TaxID=1734446 RepID=UPI0020206375|nr:hypothetical protein [Actinoplanes maris]
MSDRYQVIAECAYVKTSDMAGVSWRLYEKGAVFSGDTPNLQHLLDNGYAAKVGGEATGGVDAAGIPSGAYEVEVPEGVTSTPVAKTEEQLQAEREAEANFRAAADLAEKRAAAKAKLPANNEEPDGRASQAVWVEYLVARGSNYDDVKDADKAELQKLAKQQAK